MRLMSLKKGKERLVGRRKVMGMRVWKMKGIEGMGRIDRNRWCSIQR